MEWPRKSSRSDNVRGGTICPPQVSQQAFGQVINPLSRSNGGVAMDSLEIIKVRYLTTDKVSVVHTNRLVLTLMNTLLRRL